VALSKGAELAERAFAQRGWDAFLRSSQKIKYLWRLRFCKIRFSWIKLEKVQASIFKGAARRKDGYGCHFAGK